VFVTRIDYMCFYRDLFIIIMSLSTMNYLYRNIIQNEDMCKKCLSIRGLLPVDQTCTKIKNQTICGGESKQVLKKNHSSERSEIRIHNYTVVKIFTVDSILNHQMYGR
jgi:hypothetical protein